MRTIDSINPNADADQSAPHDLSGPKAGTCLMPVISVVEIREIDAATLAKMIASVTGGLSILWAAIVSCFLLTKMGIHENVIYGMVGAWIQGIMIPGFCYIAGLMTAYLYNFAARRIGGIQLTFYQ